MLDKMSQNNLNIVFVLRAALL